MVLLEQYRDWESSEPLRGADMARNETIDMRKELYGGQNGGRGIRCIFFFHELSEAVR